MRRIEALGHIVDLTTDLPLVVTCAATSRELASVADRDSHLYILDAMGLVGSISSGLAIAAQDTAFSKVVGLEGDGSLLMNPNVLPTGGYLAPEKLLLIVLDNNVYGSTANLPTYANLIDLAAIAEATGWEVRRASDEASMRRGFAELLNIASPGFLYVRIDLGNATGIPKLLVDPVTITNRFKDWFELTGSNG